MVWHEIEHCANAKTTLRTRLCSSHLSLVGEKKMKKKQMLFFFNLMNLEGEKMLKILGKSQNLENVPKNLKNHQFP